jgi:hypothetical protein
VRTRRRGRTKIDKIGKKQSKKVWTDMGFPSGLREIPILSILTYQNNTTKRQKAETKPQQTIFWYGGDIAVILP